MGTYTLTGGPISSSTKSIRIRFPRFEVPSLSGTSVSSVSVTLPFRLASGYSTGNYSVTLILCTGISNSNWYEYDTSGYSYYGTDTGDSSDRIYSGYYSHVIPSSKILATTTGTISFSANQTNTPTTFTFSGLNLSTSSIGSTLGVAVLYSNSGALEYYAGKSCTGTITTSTNYTIRYNGNDDNAWTNWPSNQTKPSGVNVSISSLTPICNISPTSTTYVTLNYNGNGSSNSTYTIKKWVGSYNTFHRWNDNNGSGDYFPGDTYSTDANAELWVIGWWNEDKTVGFTLPTPTRSGYTFNGWYSASSGGTKVGNGGDTYTDTTYSTIYAQWSQSTFTYTIQFNGNGNTGGSIPSSISKSGTSTSVVMGDIGSSVPTKTGYTFRGWSASSSYSSKRIAYSSSNGGGADVNGVSATTTSSSWTYANYCSNTGGSTSSRILTLYAQWEANRYTISYDANGGSGAPSSQTKIYGTALTLSSTKPTRTSSTATITTTLNYNGNGTSNGSKSTTKTTSYTFKNWNTNSSGTGTSYNAGASYTANAAATLYAQWTTNNPTYSSFTLPTPTWTGHTFNGWYTASSGGTKVGNGGVSYSPTSSGTIYAQWTADTYTVSYNANGGSGAPSNQTKTYGVALTLSSTKPTKSSDVSTITTTFKTDSSTTYSTITSDKTINYSFKNWNTSSNGSGTSYSSGGSYTANAAVTLYAQYDSSTSYESFSLDKPTLTNFEFIGWYSAASGGTLIWNGEGTYQPTSNQTLYAQWGRTDWKALQVYYFDEKTEGELNPFEFSEIKYYDGNQWINFSEIRYYVDN